MLKNGLIRKIRVFSKFMASQPEKLTMAIHILPNISRSKVKSDSKSGKLIEKKFLLKNHTQNVGEKLSAV